MALYYVNKEEFLNSIHSFIKPCSVVLDIGCGIRPQTIIEPKVHICCDPHLEYIEHLRKIIDFYRGNDLNNFEINPFCTLTKENNSEFVFINSDWENALKLFPQNSVDTIFLLDVIEHLDKDRGLRLIKLTETLCRKQIVLFTPLGFIEQEHDTIEDAWGLSGANLQKHLSGWLPDEFGEGWEIIVCKDFHEFDNDGNKYEEPKGAFWAVKNLDSDMGNGFSTLISKAVMNFKKENWNEAEKQFKQCIKYDYSNSEIYNYLGLIYGKLEKKREAIDSFRECYRLTSQNESYAFNYAKSLLEIGETKRCLEVCQNYLQYNNEIVNLISRCEQDDLGAYSYKYKIFNISEKILLLESTSSTLYTCVINQKKLVYKVINKNILLDLDFVFQSYKNLFHLNNQDDFVRIYDYKYSEDGEKVEILMEFLEGYENIRDLRPEHRKKCATIILDVIKNILSQGFIPIECGIEKFLVNGDDFKLIGSDLVISLKEMNSFYSTMFITRLEEIASWCNEVKPEIETMISLFKEETEKHFHSFSDNKQAEEYLRLGENCLTEVENPQKAIFYFNKAVKLKPNYADAFNNLGVAFWALDHTFHAYLSLRTAMDLDPQNEVYSSNYNDIVKLIMQEAKIN